MCPSQAAHIVQSRVPGEHKRVVRSFGVGVLDQYALLCHNHPWLLSTVPAQTAHINQGCFLSLAVRTSLG